MGGRSRGFNTGAACLTASAGCGAAPHGFELAVRKSDMVKPLGGQGLGGDEGALFGQDGISDACEFIGERDHGDIGVSTLQ